ncbi:hypothetical protein Bca101_009795 [Brassica carinata]
MKRACVWVFKLGSVLEWPNSYQKASDETLPHPVTPSEPLIYIKHLSVPAAIAAVPYFTFNSLRLGRSAQSVVGRLIRFWVSRNINKNGEFMGITILLLDELDSVIHGFIVVYYAFSFCIDDLLRFVHSNSFVEGVSQKIRRQIKELERISGVESNVLSLLLLMEFLMILISQGLVWDEAKYPTMSPLKEVVVLWTIFSLRLRRLRMISRFVFLSITMCAVNSTPLTENKVGALLFATSQACCLQVPRSSKKLFEDNEYALYTVTHFTQASVISSRAFLEGILVELRVQISELGHVKDLATGFLAVLGNEEASREIFNISGEKYVTFDGLARACAKAGGFPEPEIVHYNPKEFDFGKKKAFPFLDQVIPPNIIVDNCNVILGAIINGEMWRSR